VRGCWTCLVTEKSFGERSRHWPARRDRARLP
jgi:hypothetical protein